SSSIGDEHLWATGSDQLLELTSRQAATGERAWACQGLLHRGTGGLTDQHFPRVRSQGKLALGGPLTESLKSIVRHVPYLQGRRHPCHYSMQNACTGLSPLACAEDVHVEDVRGTRG